MRIAYENWAPRDEAVWIVQQANEICSTYQRQGYDLTLRQLYYQFVARALIPNNDRSYKRLGSIVDKARLAGLLDWDYIVDRTRNLSGVGHWPDPSSVIRSAARGYRIDKWTTQDVRVEVWVEKEALAGVVGQAARAFDVDFFSCRGYVSQSEMWAASQRLRGYIEGGQRVVILHLGDHDPSGLDMTRDIRDRLMKFVFSDHYRDRSDEIESLTYGAIGEHMEQEFDLDGEPLTIDRIALNMDQIEEYDPPPNPAKLTDARAERYIERYGPESWELDALEPQVLTNLITDTIAGIVDADEYGAREDQESTERTMLGRISDSYSEIVEQFG